MRLALEAEGGTVSAAARAKFKEAEALQTETERILNADLDPHWTDENGWTQLHWAAADNDGEAAHRLLELGADPNFVGKGDVSVAFSEKGTARLRLSAHGSRTLHRLNAEWSTDLNVRSLTPLLVAAAFNSPAVVADLIVNSAEVNAKDKNKGRTPLHFAASNNMAEIAKLLIEKGAEVKAKNNDGSTPLHWAAWKNAAEVAKMLLEKGAEVNAKNIIGKTPLHYAAYWNAAEVAKMLLDKGADVKAKNNYGSTPLHYAAWKNAAAVAKILIDKGANIEAKDNNGDTPLHWAVWENAAAVAKMLIEKGAEVNAKVEKGDYAGWTPMDAAIGEKHAEMQSFLKQHGGRCNTQC